MLLDGIWLLAICSINKHRYHVNLLILFQNYPSQGYPATGQQYPPSGGAYGPPGSSGITGIPVPQPTGAPPPTGQQLYGTAQAAAPQPVVPQPMQQSYAAPQAAAAPQPMAPQTGTTQTF